MAIKNLQREQAYRAPSDFEKISSRAIRMIAIIREIHIRGNLQQPDDPSGRLYK